MNKLIQLIEATLCRHELEKPDKREKGFHGTTGAFDSLTGSLAFFLILAFGIFMGWIHIPGYLGDGYSYDNFDRK